LNESERQPLPAHLRRLPPGELRRLVVLKHNKCVELRARNHKLVELVEKMARRLDAMAFCGLAMELRAAIEENADGE